jgi:hypothetical protein
LTLDQTLNCCVHVASGCAAYLRAEFKESRERIFYLEAHDDGHFTHSVWRLRDKRGQSPPIIFICFNSSHANQLTFRFITSLFLFFNSQIMYREKYKRLREITLKSRKLNLLGADPYVLISPGAEAQRSFQPGNPI